MAVALPSVCIGLQVGEWEGRSSIPVGSSASLTTKSTSVDSGPPSAISNGGSASLGWPEPGGTRVHWTSESSPGRCTMVVTWRGEDCAASKLVSTSYQGRDLPLWASGPNRHRVVPERGRQSLGLVHHKRRGGGGQGCQRVHMVCW